MSVDDRVDIITELPEELAEEILSIMQKAEQEETSSFMEYDHETAGGIMSSDFFIITKESMIKQSECL